MMQSDITFRMLTIYKAVFEMGSFSAVARKTGVSPSVVSRAILSLETAVGKQLLNRNTRSLIPTADGEIFYQFACTSLLALEQCEASLNQQLHEPSGLIRINAPLIFGRKHIAPWIMGLRQKYPALTVELNQTDSFIDPHKEPVDLLFRISALDEASWHAKIFCLQRYYLAASPEYLSRHPKITGPDSLRDHHSLVYAGPEGKQKWHFRDELDEWRRLEYQEVMTSNNGDSLVIAALSGLGMVLFPDWLIGEYIRQGTLCEVMPGIECAIKTTPHYVTAFYPRRKFSSGNIRAVIDYFDDIYGSPPYWK